MVSLQFLLYLFKILSLLLGTLLPFVTPVIPTLFIGLVQCCSQVNGLTLDLMINDVLPAMPRVANRGRGSQCQ